MKFNEDLFRDLLIEVEYLKPNSITDGEDFMETFLDRHKEYTDKGLVIEHIVLSREAGFILCDFVIIGPREHRLLIMERLTFEGHQFVSKIRDDGIWNKIKKWSIKLGTQGSVSVLNKLADKAIGEAYDQL